MARGGAGEVCKGLPGEGLGEGCVSGERGGGGGTGGGWQSERGGGFPPPLGEFAVRFGYDYERSAG